MAISTGVPQTEIAALSQRITQRQARLRALLPDAALGRLRLVCGCSNCIDPDAYKALVSTSPAAFTPDLVSKYFGGAGAEDVAQDAEARAEAFAIFLHVLDRLAEAVRDDRATERAYQRRWWFVEPDYWTRTLFNTGFVEVLDPAPRRLITDQLADLLDVAIATGSARLEDCLVYLGRTTPALPRLLAGLRSGPPRRHLAFWAGIGGGAVNSPAGMKNAGVSDFRRSYWLLDEADLRLLEEALADPATGRMMERYAFAARDRDWLGYLSRLVAWRENTILRNAETRANPPLR